MFVSYKDSSVRLTGRWDKSNPDFCETVNTGAYIEFAYEGKDAVALFDTEGNGMPALHLWIQLDGGDMYECPIDAYMRVRAADEGNHVCRIIYKGGIEHHRRWSRPLHGKVSFRGYNADKPSELEADNRKTIEFVGDSITEGILIDTDYYGEGKPQYDVESVNEVYTDDVCASYGWLTAEKLNMKPIIDGFGSQGVTRHGNGGIPAETVAYGYNFENSPITHKSDIVVINHGANDRPKGVSCYLENYGKVLDLVRKKQPDAVIVSLSMFCGKWNEELGDFIKEYNKKNNTDVKFIDSKGWVSPEPLHPMRDGHRAIAEYLAPLIEKIINN